MECISLCGIPCLCALSASAFIYSSLHQLDSFWKSFYGDLSLFFFDMHKNYWGEPERAPRLSNGVPCNLHVATLCLHDRISSAHLRTH